MNTNIIRSGTGLMTGFENVINPTSKHGQVLLDQGFRW
jgi:uracil phosphoribosyltransferase